MARGCVLVVGGAGYVGSHVTLALRERGWNVVVFDNLCTGLRELVLDAELVVGDLRSPAALDAVFTNHRFDCVMHFAAHAYVGESMTEPERYYLNNVANTLNLLIAMRRYGVGRLVFSSTCAVYGVPAVVPIDEDSRCDPVSPYGHSKLMVERFLADYARAYGLAYVALRYFNAAGADPAGRIGECHEPETHLIPLALRASGRANQRLSIFGSDYPTPDGTCIRDYTHVCDLASAHVAALEHLSDAGRSLTCNLGTGDGHSVLEVLRCVAEVSGMEVAHHIEVRRPGDPPALVARVERARSVLGWEPVHPDLRGIVESAWRWHQQRAEKGAP